MSERGSDEDRGTTGGRHAAPEGAGTHPLIDLSRDPNPGKADHAAGPEDDE